MDDSVLDYARELVQGLLKSCLDKFRGDVSWPKGGQFSPEAAQDCIEELVQVSGRESSFISSLPAPPELGSGRELEALH